MRDNNLKFQAIPALLIGMVIFSSAFLAFSFSTKPFKNQQQSLSAVLKLITDEIIKPLHTAEKMVKAHGLDAMMNNSDIEHQAMLDKVAEMSGNLQMDFFVASENSRKQYNADGTWLELKEAQVEWYFRARDKKQALVVSLGQNHKVQIYYDMRVVSESGKFLGFISVSKNLDVFLKAFERYKASFGYDFVVVNNNQDVVLSSNATKMSDGARILSLTELDWYQTLNEKQKHTASLNNAIVSSQDNTFKIIELELKRLNLTLYLLTPSSIFATIQTNIFKPQTALIIVSIIFVFMWIPLFMLYINKNKNINNQKDKLNKSPDRASLQKDFDEIRRTRQALSLIIIDIDQKQFFNSKAGPHVGDLIMFDINKLLESNLREGDAVVRWDEGEKFVILLPATDLTKASSIAEFLRNKIARHTIEVDGNVVSISASFGLTYTKHANTIERLVSYADDALYQAKRDGHSMIRMRLVDNT